MAASRWRIRLAFARARPGRCISLICAIPTATSCARCIASRPELSPVNVNTEEGRLFGRPSRPSDFGAIAATRRLFDGLSPQRCPFSFVGDPPSPRRAPPRRGRRPPARTEKKPHGLIDQPLRDAPKGQVDGAALLLVIERRH